MKYSRISAAFAIIVGTLVLFGWINDLPLLKSMIPGLTPMNPVSAILFMLGGLAVGLLGPNKISQRITLLSPTKPYLA